MKSTISYKPRKINTCREWCGSSEVGKSSSIERKKWNGFGCKERRRRRSSDSAKKIGTIHFSHFSFRSGLTLFCSRVLGRKEKETISTQPDPILLRAFPLILFYRLLTLLFPFLIGLAKLRQLSAMVLRLKSTDQLLWMSTYEELLGAGLEFK